MQNSTTTTAPARYAAEAPLALHTIGASRRRGLAAARQAGPVLRQTRAGHRPSAAEELQAVRDALADPRTTQERVLDRVADRLIAALTL